MLTVLQMCRTVQHVSAYPFETNNMSLQHEPTSCELVSTHSSFSREVLVKARRQAQGPGSARGQ